MALHSQDKNNHQRIDAIFFWALSERLDEIVYRSFGTISKLSTESACLECRDDSPSISF
jgi:hypothetical protein